MTDNTENLIKVPAFAKEKNTTRLRIYNLIKLGVLVPEVIGDVQFIDKEKYKDFDPKARVKREVALATIIEQNEQLKRRLHSLEKVVYAGSEDGRGPAKNKD